MGDNGASSSSSSSSSDEEEDYGPIAGAWGDQKNDTSTADWSSLIDPNAKIGPNGLGTGGLHRKGRNYKPVDEKVILEQRLKSTSIKSAKKKKSHERRKASSSTSDAGRPKAATQATSDKVPPKTTITRTVISSTVNVMPGHDRPSAPWHRDTVLGWDVTADWNSPSPKPATPTTTTTTIPTMTNRTPIPGSNGTTVAKKKLPIRSGEPPITQSSATNTPSSSRPSSPSPRALRPLLRDVTSPRSQSPWLNQPLTDKPFWEEPAATSNNNPPHISHNEHPTPVKEQPPVLTEPARTSDSFETPPKQTPSNMEHEGDNQRMRFSVPGRRKYSQRPDPGPIPINYRPGTRIAPPKEVAPPPPTENPVLVTIQVELEPGKKIPVDIRLQDDPAVLAAKFSREHSITSKPIRDAVLELFSSQKSIALRRRKILKCT